MSGYRPAAEEMAEAVAWLATDEGHAWQDAEIDRLKDAGLLEESWHGLSWGAWISLKSGVSERYVAVWIPPRPREFESDQHYTWWHIGYPPNFEDWQADDGWVDSARVRRRSDRCWTCGVRHDYAEAA